MWTKPDTEMIDFAVDEMVKIGFIEKKMLLIA